MLENILTSTQMYVVKGYGLKADPELLGNRISIMANNISARKYPECARSSFYLGIFSLRNSTGSPELFRVTTCNHGSALMLCKSLQSRAVFLHLNVYILKTYKSVLFVKREISLVVPNSRCSCNSAGGDSIRVWFDSYSEWQDAALTVDLLWPNKSVLFVKDNNVQLG